MDLSKLENFVSENKSTATILYWIGFITSGYISYRALSGNSELWYIWLAYTVVMESGKAICYLNYVKTDLKKYFIMWIILTFFSIAASMAFFIIENNISENKAQTSSVSFQQTKDKEARLKEQIAIKKGLLSQATKDSEDSKTLTNEYNKSINSLQAQINLKKLEEGIKATCCFFLG